MTYLSRLFAETGLRLPGQPNDTPATLDRTGVDSAPVFEIEEIREEAPATFGPPASPAATPMPMPPHSAPAPEPDPTRVNAAAAPADTSTPSRSSLVGAAPDAAPSPAIEAAAPPLLAAREQPSIAAPLPVAPVRPVVPPGDTAPTPPLARDRSPAASETPFAPPPPGSSPTLAEVQSWVAAGPSPQDRHDRVTPPDMSPSAPEIVAGSDQITGVGWQEERAVNVDTPRRGAPAVQAQTLSIGTIELTVEAPPPAVSDPPRTPAAHSPAPPTDGAVQRLRRHYVHWWGGP